MSLQDITDCTILQCDLCIVMYIIYCMFRLNSNCQQIFRTHSGLLLPDIGFYTLLYTPLLYTVQFISFLQTKGFPATVHCLESLVWLGLGIAESCHSGGESR